VLHGAALLDTVRMLVSSTGKPQAQQLTAVSCPVLSYPAVQSSTRVSVYLSQELDARLLRPLHLHTIPVYSATVPTERGDIVRVWEYDRVNHTVWSVDMLFEGDTLWAHPRITNPSATQDLNGYWWTNVGQKITVAGTERVVMPAKYDYAGVPWCVTCLLSPSILAAVTQANWRAMHSVRSITGRQATTSFQRVQWARTTEWTAVARTSQACPSVPFACKFPSHFLASKPR